MLLIPFGSAINYKGIILMQHTRGTGATPADLRRSCPTGGASPRGSGGDGLGTAAAAAADLGLAM